MGNLIDRVTGVTALREEKARLEAERDLERARAAQAEIDRDLERARAEQAEALREGRYYATIDRVWDAEDVAFSSTDLDSIRRNARHRFYEKTCEVADKPGDELHPAFNSGRSRYDPGSSLSENTGDSKTEKKRKQRLKEVTLSGRHIRVADVAHLIPHSATCAHFYGPLAEAAVGMDVENDSALSPATKKLKRLVIVHGQYSPPEKNSHGSDKTPKRRRDTGIKHCRTNMARVVAQKLYLDFSPSLLILPLLDQDETLKYNGGKYHVLVACTDQAVYRETMLTDKHELCTSDDIRKATKTLAKFVQAAAYTLCLAERDEISTRLKHNHERKTILATYDLVKQLGAKIKIPKTGFWSADATEDTPPRLAKLALDLEDENAHQECDPFLLFVKAAVVWSTIQGQKLLPSCSPPHDCDECLAQGLWECECEAYDPYVPIPSEILVPIETATSSTGSDGKYLLAHIIMDLTWCMELIGL